MNKNPNSTLDSQRHNAPLRGAHRAEPIEIDNHGQRQRARQYEKEQNAQINRLKNEDPNYVKHKNYTQPTAKRKKVSVPIILLILFLAIVFFFTSSLFAVYLVATAAKNAMYPPAVDLTPDDTSIVDTSASDSDDSQKDSMVIEVDQYSV